MNKEAVYARMRAYVLCLYNMGIKIKIGDLLTWVNTHCRPLIPRPYGNLRSVIGAPWRRGTYEEQDALEWCLLNKVGDQLLK